MSNSSLKAVVAVSVPDLAAEAGRADLPAIKSSVLKTFADDRSGSTGIMFGLLLAPLMLMIGIAVDYSRTISVRHKTQLALDGAALAASTVAMRNPGDPNLMTNAGLAATAYFNSARPAGVTGSPVITPTYTNDTTKFTAALTTASYVKTPFLSFAGAFNSGVGTISDTGAPAECKTGPLACMQVNNAASSYASHGGANSSIEVSMMLDITGSMGEAAGGGLNKLQAVQAAANAAIDQMIWTDQSTWTSKVAIVPFSEGVRLSTSATSSSVANTSSYQLATSVSPSNIGVDCKRYNGSACDNIHTKYYQSGCVVERTGTNKYNDVAPGAGNYFMVEYAPGSSGNDSCSVPSDAVIQPLTNNKATLHALVNALQHRGGTAGQLGTVWAWNMLSPNFNTLWPTANQAAPYSAVTAGTMKKIAILMTDGDYNTEYDTNGIDTGYSGASPANDWSQNQAGTLCTNMKAAQIEVYTIAAGTGMSQASRNFLLACASDASHNYNATDTTAIAAAFHDIATKISSPRLTN